MSDSETDTEDHPVPPPRKPRFRDYDPESTTLDTTGALLGPIISGKDVAAAHEAVTMLRDVAGMSFVFSSPESQRAPPCGNESIFLDDTAFEALAALDAAAGQALRKALDKSRRAVENALGGGPVEQASLPMASVGGAGMWERFHYGADGLPAEADGESLLLTAVAFLEDASDAGARVLLPDKEAAEPAKPAARKRARSSSAGAVSGGDGVSFAPVAGQLLLLAPGTARSLRSGPLTLTTWWRRPLLEQQPKPKGAGAQRKKKAGDASLASAGASVYDGVLSTADRRKLAEAPLVRWAVYDRLGGAGPRNAHERGIESLLSAMGDASRWVEYWGRARWDAIPAHFDCDEAGPLKKASGGGGGGGGEARTPTSAHVLYLAKAEGVAAPTVLWARRSGGAAEELVTVPAVEGRLLRFDGSWVHGVPRPAREYLGENDAEAEEGAEAEMGEEAGEEEEGGEEEEEGDEESEEEGEEEGEEEASEEEEEEEEEVLRHVLLFNTWADQPPGEEEEEAGAGAGGGDVPSGEPIFLYWWDARDGAALSGWWATPNQVGDSTWYLHARAAEGDGDAAAEAAEAAAAAATPDACQLGAWRAAGAPTKPPPKGGNANGGGARPPLRACFARDGGGDGDGDGDGDGVALRWAGPDAATPIGRAGVRFDQLCFRPHGGRTNHGKPVYMAPAVAYEDRVSVGCRPRKQWREAPLPPSPGGGPGGEGGGASTAFVARLMGGPRRRRRAMRFRVDDVAAPRAAVRAALTSQQEPARFALR